METWLIQFQCRVWYFIPLFLFFSQGLLFLSMIATFALIFPLHLKSRETPTNYILLAAFVSRLFIIMSSHAFYCTTDMGMKLLWLRLHEAETFEAKASASASASCFQKLKASDSASWLWKSFGFSFGFVTSQIQNFTLGFVVSKLEKLYIFHFQIMFVCIFCLNFNKWQVFKGKKWYL